MKIDEVREKSAWKKFLLDCQEKSFLQTWSWGEFNKLMGNKIWYFGVYDGNELVLTALVVRVAARRGTFLLVPHGPNINKQRAGDKKEFLKILLEKLKKIAEEEKASFIRVNPIWARTNENNKVFKDLGFKSAPIHIHPEASWKLDITPLEEDLLMQMRKTTRYLIRQALKNKDIEIFQSSKVEDIKTFDKLYQEVVKTQHFIPFSLDYLKKEFGAFSSDNQISLFFGKYQGEVVASSFVLFCSNIGFYHHAALNPKYHKTPVSYLLQWEAIKEAKRRGCTLYDFWGYVDPKTQSRHPWAGPTLFKMGFGGEAHQYVKTQDFPLSWKYWLTYAFEKLRKTKRGL